MVLILVSVIIISLIWMDGCLNHANLMHGHLQCQMSVVYSCRLQALRLHKSCHTYYIISLIFPCWGHKMVSDLCWSWGQNIYFCSSISKERERECVKCLNDPIMWKLLEYPNTLYAALGIFVFFSGACKGNHHGYYCSFQYIWKLYF